MQSRSHEPLLPSLMYRALSALIGFISTKVAWSWVCIRFAYAYFKIRRLFVMSEARAVEMNARLSDLDVGHDDVNFSPVGQANVGVQHDLPLFHDAFKGLCAHSLALDLSEQRGCLNFFLDLTLRT